MKILMLSTNSDEAGAPRNAEQIINGLEKKHEFIFVSGQKGKVYKRLQRKGFCVYRIKELKSKISIMKDLISIFKLVQIISRVKPDIIHMHSSKAGLVGRVAAIFFDIKSIYSVHGWGWRGMNHFKKNIIFFSEYFVSKLKKTKYILVCHALEKYALKQLSIKKENIEVILNGIDDIKPSKKEHIYTKKLNLIMPARTDKSKDHDSLFRALKTIDYPFRLVLCGSGTDCDNFKKNAYSILGKKTKEIEFLGEISNINDFLVEADVFILSSNFEALPISIIEAQRSALAIIATNIGGVPELITDKKDGLLFNKNDHNELAILLDKLKNPDFRKLLGTNARNKFLTKFTSKMMIENIEKIYVS